VGDSKNYSFKQFLKDYWDLLEGQRFKFGYFTFIMILSNLVPFLSAYLLGKIIDFFTNYHVGEPLTKFYIFAGILTMSVVGQVWSRFYAKMNISDIAAKIKKDMRMKSVSHFLDLELKWHEKTATGKSIHKLNTGGDSAYRLMQLYYDSGISILVGIIGSIIIFSVLEWYYVLFAAIYATIYLGGEYYYNKKVKETQHDLNIIKERVSGKIHESASNVLTVKSLGLKQMFVKALEGYEQEYYKIWRKAKNVGQNKFRNIKMFSALGYGLFIFILGNDFVGGAITLGMIAAYAGYFGKLKSSLEELTNTSSTIIESYMGFERGMGLLREKVKKTDESKLKEVPEDWKEIKFNDVLFTYKEKYVLKNFSLTLKRGEHIGIVGKSGEGKSTLIKLLLGLYKPERGVIYLDGIPLSKYKPSSLINNFGVVLQDSEMFNMSLVDNVSISQYNLNKKEFSRAIKIADLSHLIKKMPQRENTLIGEKGYKVSGGERQRIGIARAVYRKTPLLILDEATSHLDSSTESRVQSELNNELRDVTLIIIAHRLSTLKNVDKIIVIERGKIVEEGKFDELLNNSGLFNRLYKLQKYK